MRGGGGEGNLDVSVSTFKENIDRCPIVNFSIKQIEGHKWNVEYP